MRFFVGLVVFIQILGSGCGLVDDNSSLSSSESLENGVLCPSYISDNDLMKVDEFEQTRFRSYGNYFLTEVLKKKPFHFAKDLIVGEGLSGRLQAKFDYGSVIHKDLEYEIVESYLWAEGDQGWSFLGDQLTNSDGKVYLDLANLSAGEYGIRFMVKGDGSQADGRISVVQASEKAVVFDLDETLTTSDLEIVADYLDVKTAAYRDDAIELVKLYAERGYRIIYLSARPYIFLQSTQEWLALNDFPRGHLQTPEFVEDTVASDDRRKFKKDYLDYLVDTVGLDIVAAYGNATTDIEAYEQAGIPKETTYIVGRNGGQLGTVDLGESFTEQVAALRESLPHSGCI